MHFLDSRLQLALEQLCAHDGGAVALPGAITVRLGRYILGEPFSLRFPERAKGIVVERRVKSNAGGVKLLDDRDVEALLRNQSFDVAATPGSRNRRVEQGLRQKAPRKREGAEGRFIRAFTTLQAGEALNLQIGQRDGMENKATAGGLFKGQPCLDDLRIFFKRPGEGGLEGDRICVRETKEDKSADQSCLL